MNRRIKDNLIQAGVDVDEAVDRFAGAEALLEKFLKRFLDDTSFENIEKALEDGNCEEAFRFAHNLKGVCTNMSINSFGSRVSDMVELLRSGNMESARKSIASLRTEYDRVSEGIRQSGL